MGKEKKEIGKLLELYRNYLTDEIKKEMYVNGADKECIDMFEADEVEEERLYKFLNQLSVLKKFVKWLVDNDKIDTDIVYQKGFLAKTYDKDEAGECFEPYEEILMLLSISDEPIDFLCSILKEGEKKESEGKLVKGGYASFNEYGELMEADTLQELKDLGKI